MSRSGDAAAVGVGLEVEPMALGGKNTGTSGLQITNVTMPDNIVKKLQFYGLPDNEPAEIRKGDRLLAVNGTIVCGRPVLHMRGLLDRTSNPWTIVVLRSTTAQATRATAAKVRGGGKGRTAQSSTTLFIRGKRKKRGIPDSGKQGRQALASKGATRSSSGGKRGRHALASKGATRSSSGGKRGRQASAPDTPLSLKG